MSAYENVVGGKLKLKGKALDVKSGSIKKKKKQKKQYDEVSETKQEEKLDSELIYSKSILFMFLICLMSQTMQFMSCVVCQNHCLCSLFNQ